MVDLSVDKIILLRIQTGQKYVMHGKHVHSIAHIQDSVLFHMTEKLVKGCGLLEIEIPP